MKKKLKSWKPKNQWERNFEVTFGIFSVIVSQINVLESYLDIYLFKISYDQKYEKWGDLGR